MSDTHNSEPDIERVDAAVFATILETAVLAIGFDEVWYLNKHEDIKEAVEAGRMPSALHHYVWHGFREGRQPFAIKVDSAFYLEAYPDVRTAIENGQFKNAQVHFDEAGRAEGRMPNKDFDMFKKRKGTLFGSTTTSDYVAAASRIGGRFLDRGARSSSPSS